MRMPRAVLVVAVFFLSALASPFASAGTTQSVTDASGDAAIHGAPTAFLDILEAEVSVNATHLGAAITLDDAALAQDFRQASLLSGLEYWLAFEYRDELFHLAIDLGLGRFVNEADPGAEMIDTTEIRLYRESADTASGWLLAANGAGFVDRAASQVSGAVALADVAALDGYSPGPGEHIVPLEVVAYFDEGPGSVHDYGRGSAVPQAVLAGGDSAPFGADALLSIPGQVSAGLAVSTPEQVRFSNGEATTYHWPVAIRNHAATALGLDVTATADDPLIEVRAPSRVEVPVGNSTYIDVFVTVPFRHEHGTSRTIELAITGSGESATIPLQIQYLDVAQPAGHHPITYLHALNPGGGQGGFAWFDTVETPDRDHDDRMELGPAVCRQGGGDESGSMTFFALSPALLIGIDARTGEPARFTGTLDVPAGTPETTLYLQVHAYDPLTFDDGALDLDYEQTATWTVPATTQAQQFDLDLDVALPDALDYLPPGGQNIGMMVGICGAASEPGVAWGLADLGASLLHGARVEWPLEEFHDILPVDAGTGPALSVASAGRRIVAGGAALWEVEVAAEAGTYAAELFGVGSDVATLHRDEVKAGESIPVSIQVPEDAKPGDVFEVVLSVASVQDPTAVTAVRLFLVVDPEGEDDSAKIAALKGPERDSPGPTLLVFVVALFAVAARVRR